MSSESGHFTSGRTGRTRAASSLHGTLAFTADLPEAAPITRRLDPATLIEHKITRTEMHKMKLTGLVAIMSIAACSDYSVTSPNPHPAPVIAPPKATVVTATGDVTEKVEAFRLTLGGSNGGTAG